jgi:hypothetical protein
MNQPGQDKDEYHGWQRVTLSKPSLMDNKIPGNTIQKDLSEWSGQQSTDHITPYRSETQLLHHLNQEGPWHWIKHFWYIQLEKDSGLILLMQEPGSLLHKRKVILDEVLLDECWLVCGHHLLQPPSQPIGQDFSNQLCKTMHQTDGPIVFHTLSRFHLWQ